jgi:hypothetical protein
MILGRSKLRDKKTCKRGGNRHHDDSVMITSGASMPAAVLNFVSIMDSGADPALRAHCSGACGKSMSVVRYK